MRRNRRLTRRHRAQRSTVPRLARRVLLVWRSRRSRSEIAIAMVGDDLGGAELRGTGGRKPSVFFPVSGSLSRIPAQTWREHGPLFETHSTAAIHRARGQVESSGNPVARTYWRWRFSWNPFEAYRPASSAVGMFQMTDGTFAEARRYCIHDHVVVEDGPHEPAVMLVQWAHTRAGPLARGGNRQLLASHSRAHRRRSPHRHCRCSSVRTSRQRSTCAAAGQETPTHAAGSGSNVASDADLAPLSNRSERAEAAVRAPRIRLTAVSGIRGNFLHSE